jgi:hypothetical protein
VLPRDIIRRFSLPLPGEVVFSAECSRHLRQPLPSFHSSAAARRHAGIRMAGRQRLSRSRSGATCRSRDAPARWRAAPCARWPCLGRGPIAPLRLRGTWARPAGDAARRRLNPAMLWVAGRRAGVARALPVVALLCVATASRVAARRAARYPGLGTRLAARGPGPAHHLSGSGTGAGRVAGRARGTAALETLSSGCSRAASRSRRARSALAPHAARGRGLVPPCAWAAGVPVRRSATRSGPAAGRLAIPQGTRPAIRSTGWSGRARLAVAPRARLHGRRAGGALRGRQPWSHAAGASVPREPGARG